jgi:hypothetical protein
MPYTLHLDSVMTSAIKVVVFIYVCLSLNLGLRCWNLFQGAWARDLVLKPWYSLLSMACDCAKCRLLMVCSCILWFLFDVLLLAGKTKPSTFVVHDNLHRVKRYLVRNGRPDFLVQTVAWCFSRPWKSNSQGARAPSKNSKSFNTFLTFLWCLGCWKWWETN